MHFPLFIALKFIKGSKNNISTMILVCFISILTSSCALILVASIMNGFEKTTHKTLQSIHSDIMIQNDNIELESIIPILEKEKAILAYSPSSTNQIIIQNNNIQNSAIIKGIQPESEILINNINSMILNGNLNSLNDDKSIIIGYRLAKILKVIKNDKLQIFFNESSDNIIGNRINLESRVVKIAGVFKTGIDEFDEHLIYCSLNLFQDLFDLPIKEIGIKINKKHSKQSIVQSLQEKTGLNIISWEELYPAIVSTLALEKYVMIILLAIMSFIASMNIISLLFMFITKKQKDIVILKLMGLESKNIINIFIILGLVITFSASLTGLIIGGLICLLLKKFPIKIPDAYYTNVLPVELDTKILTIILVIIIAINIISTIYPAIKAKYINLTKIFE